MQPRVLAGFAARLRGLMVDASRLDALRRFYAALDRIEDRVDGRRLLAECDGRMAWPRRGVYFFFEPGEARVESGPGSRVVRVGTHALTARSRTTLWNRLAQHRGVARDGGGNHRGSIFRLLVGAALMRREPALRSATWGRGASAPGEVREAERALERRVSATIGAMSLLWLGVDDDPGRISLRGDIERGAIGLLSNYQRSSLDKPSARWLGRHSDRPRVRDSGLWNSNHVELSHTLAFLDDLERLIEGGAGIQVSVAGDVWPHAEQPPAPPPAAGTPTTGVASTDARAGSTSPAPRLG